jgi:hypothetical protein
MVRQRAKYYKEEKVKYAKEILHVPEKYRNFAAIQGLNRLHIEDVNDNKLFSARLTEQDVVLEHK